MLELFRQYSIFLGGGEEGGHCISLFFKTKKTIDRLHAMMIANILSIYRKYIENHFGNNIKRCRE